MNDPTITQESPKFTSSMIMPSSGLELFFDISCPSLRCRAGPRGPRSHWSTDDLPIPLLSVPRTLTKVQTLLPWRNCFPCGSPLEFQLYKAICPVTACYSRLFASLVPLTLYMPFDNSHSRLHLPVAGIMKSAPCGIFTVADLRRDTALISG